MKFPRLPRLRAADVAAVVLSAGVAVASAAWAYGGAWGGAAGLRVVVEGEGGKTWIYPAEAHETVDVRGPLGFTKVEIDGGRVRVVSSPCQNQTCVAAGAAEAPGQWIACLPNAVFVRIEGNSHDDEPDAATW